MKLHCGCGTVYLDGYINIDASGMLGSEFPNELNKNKTTFNHYYKEEITKKDFLNMNYKKQRVVVDMFADVRNLPFSDNSVEEIIAVQLVEHFTFDEVEKLLKHWLKKLQHGGKLYIDVPDIAGIIRQADHDRDYVWAIRQLFGSQKNEYSVHKSGFTEESMAEMLLNIGFVNVEHKDLVKHTYPAIGFIAYKTRVRGLNPSK